MQFLQQRFARLLLPALLLCACDMASSEAPSSLLDADELAMDEELDTETIATVILESGGAVEFTNIGSGGIAVYEQIPEGSYSPVEILMDGEGATPLEVFLAIAPPEREVPEVLTAAHARFAAEQEIDAEPRALTFTSNNGLRSLTYLDIDPVDCSLPADGAWFDTWWTVMNWGWHKYYRGSATNKSIPYTPYTHTWQGHMCNSAISSTRLFRVDSLGPSPCPGIGGSFAWAIGVPPGHRALYRVWNLSSECRWLAETTSIWPVSGSYSLGSTKP